MGEGDMVPDNPESLANGNAELEKETGAVMDNKEEHLGEMTEMEEDKKDDGKVEANNMDMDEEINKTEEIEETVKDGDVVKEGKNNEGDEENKEEDKQAVVEEGKVEAKDEAMDDDVTGDKVDKEVGGVEDEERSEGRKPEKGLTKKRPRTKNDTGKKENINKKEPVEKKQKPKTSNEKRVEEHETSIEKKEDPKTPMTYTTDRPVRERKSVERLVATIEKDAAKEFHVEKGRGTALKDIPNVAYKLSRKKNDDTFRLLHNILFGRRGKAAEFKNNMSRFSGFVWHDDEEKQTIKVKEKLDKIVKEKLVEFCDLFDIPVSKANTRKEDIIAKLVEFLMAPHATTAELLVDKEQSSKGKKRKRTSKSASESSTPSKGPAKSSKKTESTSGKGKETKEGRPDPEDESEDKNDEAREDEDVNGTLEKSEDEMSERAESEEKDSESEESDEVKVKQKQGSAKSSVKKGSGSIGKAKTKKVTISKKANPPPEREPAKSPHSRSKSNKGTSAKSTSGKKKDEIVKEKTSTPKKSPSSVGTGKKGFKGKEKPKEAKVTPSDDELRNAICELLKEVDFNTATFTDVLKLLAKRFSEDLAPRKSSIKLMIQEELTKLADSEDEEDVEGDAKKDEKKASAEV